MGKIVFIQKKKDGEMESIFEVAKWFLSTESMTHLKLQKLCYYAQAWHLAVTRKRLVDEEFQAWMHGPVAPRLYARYRNWGWHAIIKYDGRIDLTNKTKAFLKIIYELYGELSGKELEDLTHSESPWLNARKGVDSNQSCTKKIKDEDMIQYYRRILEEATKKNGRDDG